jgi:glycosyltransferase involved in cell wall biosynthesis
MEVIFICPPGQYVDKIKKKGFLWHPWHLNRRSVAPWWELRSIFELAGIYQRFSPDVVHHITVKPILYGSIAALLRRVPKVINNFTGLGFLFSEDPRAKWLRWLILPIFRFVLYDRDFYTVLLNENDRSRLISLGVITGEKTTIIPSEGVDLDLYQPEWSDKEKRDSVIVLMAARLLWDKGVAEFVETARRVKAQYRSVEFWLAGERDMGNPACIPRETLAAWREEGYVRFLNHRDDMPELLRKVDIAVLPSYHEGIPVFLLEAAASGLPLIATDIEGCNLIIDEGTNGFLVSKKDISGLADAILTLVRDPDLRLKMGRNSRVIVEERFSQEDSLSHFLSLYRKLGVLPDGGG